MSEKIAFMTGPNVVSSFLGPLLRGPSPDGGSPLVLLLCGDERGRLRVALDVDPDTTNHR